MINKIDSWNNSDNDAFYEVLKAERMEKIAEKGGLANGCDLRELTPYWSKAQSILEVGAGYGRVIDYLLKHPFKGTITAIERCNTLFRYLTEQYQEYENVNLLHADICHQLYIGERFDLIFMLWSVIAEFAPHEQLTLIKKLAMLLKKDGQLIIDTMPENLVPLESVKYDKQIYSTEVDGAIIYTYEPNANEIKQYGKTVGFLGMKRIICQTAIGRKRWLYVLS